MNEYLELQELKYYKVIQILKNKLRTVAGVHLDAWGLQYFKFYEVIKGKGWVPGGRRHATRHLGATQFEANFFEVIRKSQVAAGMQPVTWGLQYLKFRIYLRSTRCRSPRLLQAHNLALGGYMVQSVYLSITSTKLSRGDKLGAWGATGYIHEKIQKFIFLRASKTGGICAGSSKVGSWKICSWDKPGGIWTQEERKNRVVKWTSKMRWPTKSNPGYFPFILFILFSEFNQDDRVGSYTKAWKAMTKTSSGASQNSHPS